MAITRTEERLVFLKETRHDKEDSPYLSDFRDLIDVIQVPVQVIIPPQSGALKATGLKDGDAEDGLDESEFGAEAHEVG